MKKWAPAHFKILSQNLFRSHTCLRFKLESEISQMKLSLVCKRDGWVGIESHLAASAIAT